MSGIRIVTVNCNIVYVLGPETKIWDARKAVGSVPGNYRRTGLTTFLPSHVDFRPRQSCFPELIARQQHSHRALWLQGEAVADPGHLPTRGWEVRPGLQRVYNARHEPPQRTVTNKVLYSFIHSFYNSPIFHSSVLSSQVVSTVMFGSIFAAFHIVDYVTQL